MNFVPDASVRRLEGWAGSDGTAVTQHHRRLHPGAQIAQTTKAARMLTRASREGRWHQTVKKERVPAVVRRVYGKPFCLYRDERLLLQARNLQSLTNAAGNQQQIQMTQKRR